MEILKEQLTEFLSKAWLWCAYILIGIVGKISHEYMRGRKMTWGQVFAYTGLAGTIGILTCMWCDSYRPDLTKYFGVLSTLLAREIMTAVVSINYNKLFADIAQYIADRFKK